MKNLHNNESIKSVKNREFENKKKFYLSKYFFQNFEKVGMITIFNREFSTGNYDQDFVMISLRVKLLITSGFG